MAHALRAYKPVGKLPDEPNRLAAAYGSVLHGQRALLLFDNAANREQVEPLLSPPGCLLMITSRAHFSVPGLRAIDLDSLPPADAETLLLNIALRIGSYAAQLAKLCGGLPMALRLGGSALAEREDLVPDEYIRRLDDAQTRLELIEADLLAGAQQGRSPGIGAKDVAPTQAEAQRAFTGRGIGGRARDDGPCQGLVCPGRVTVSGGASPG